MTKFSLIAIGCMLAMASPTVGNCAQPAPSPYELQAAQSHDYPADKSVVFGAALNALQDEGFSIISADIASGFISAESVSTAKTNFWDALESVSASGNTRASIVIEGVSPTATHIRVSLVATKNSSGASGQSSREDHPISGLQPYREIYSKIDAGVTQRMARGGRSANGYIDRSSVIPIGELSAPASANIAVSPSKVLAAAKSELQQQGYQIVAYDELAGVLATAPKPTHLTPDLADCGKMLGISYIRDSRVATDTQVFIEAKGGAVRVQTAIDGIYRVGYGSPDKPLTCKSRGGIEAALLTKIMR